MLLAGIKNKNTNSKTIGKNDMIQILNSIVISKSVFLFRILNRISMNDKERFYYVYILSEKKHGTLYTGVTHNVIVRTLEHRLKMSKGFAEKYDLF